MHKSLIFSIILAFTFNSSISLALDTVKINETDLLFTALKNTSPVITSKYIGWNKGWKYAGATLKADAENQVDPYKKGSFTGHVKKLDIKFNGDITLYKENLTWNYNWDKSKNISDSIGFGIEFILNLKSTSYSKPVQNPELLPANQGWRWKAPDGQTIEVIFTPALSKIYFERGNKGKIRAFFFTEMTAGSQQTTMTVRTDSRNSNKINIKGSDSLAYPPINPRTWHKNIISPTASPVDLSFLNKNDKPAGKNGFIKREKDKLLFGNGTPAKFWGANIQAYPLFNTSDFDVKKHAKRIAQLGFNLIRIHHHDSKWVSPNIFKNPENNTRELSASALKKLDWWIKCLKDEGVYIWLDLHVGRTFTENDGIPNFSDFAKGSFDAEAKGFNYLNKDIQLSMQAFNEAYLNHVNPYTKLAYKDDPAIMALLITNENDLSRHFGNAFLADKNVPQHYAIFEQDASEFASKHSLSKNKVMSTWKMGESKIYLNDVEHRFNETMINHLQTLGTKSLVATTNSWGGMGVYGLPSLTDGSIIDTHSYGKAEEINFNPRFTPGFLTWIGAAQVTGYPLSTTEWNVERFPVRDRFIVPTYLASIASLQGWDAIMQYGYSQNQLAGWNKGSNYSSYNDPAIMGAMPAAALLFRQNHVAQAKQTYELKLDRNNFFFTQQDPGTSKTIRTLLETSRLTVAIPKTPELPWLNDQIFSTTNAIAVTDPNKDFIPEGQSYVASDTGELKRDWTSGIHTINTAQSQIVSGWIGNNNIQLNAANFKIKTKKALAAVQSLENNAITESKNIFITLLARSKPGKNNALPFLSEPIIGEIEISAPAGLQLYPVNRTGTLGTAIATPYNNGRYIISLSAKNNYHWWILKP